MITLNQLSVLQNKFQGSKPRILCVCSGGVLRSPTMAWLLSQPPFNFNTRSCGTEEYALIPLTEQLIAWADEIVCAEDEHAFEVKKMTLQLSKKMPKLSTPIHHSLGIPDMFEFMSDELLELLDKKFKEIFLDEAKLPSQRS